ncbi:MAG TPA: sigma factor-like helix-turn-helix DNA-binding protein [Streptosporangiaceae bacterium]|nr:sigma factor-like helix-turn-helix DNA-binding protein [Streptosporangiaceae bacterium]
MNPTAEISTFSWHGPIDSVGAVLNQSEARRFRDGDPDVVRAVYRAYGGLVFAVAHKVLGDRGLAEEATRQAFVQAWRTAGEYDLTRDLGPRLAVIARSVAIGIRPPLTESVYDEWKARRAVAGMSADEQQVIRLQHFDGLTDAEIAERLGVPIGTVKSRSLRALRSLVGQLGHPRDGRG